MTNDFVKRLRDAFGFVRDPLIGEAADRIERMQDVIARIQYTNLRRDMNLKNRTMEIDKLCKTK